MMPFESTKLLGMEKPPEKGELLQAVRINDLEAVKALLERGADVNESDYKSVTPLIAATWRGKTEIMKALIEKGADITGGDYYGGGRFTLLFWAKHRGHTEIISLLEEAQKKKKIEIKIERPRPKNYKWDGELSSWALGLIAAYGSVTDARAFFDKAFWEGKKFTPGWEDLKAALERKDKPMQRLLVTWGAVATAAQLKGYPEAVPFLRQCGLKVKAELSSPSFRRKPESPSPAPSADSGLRRNDADEKPIPFEWKRVLWMFQQQGAAEAMIAGGALRDTFNGRAVKDVDIFLKNRGGTRRNKWLLQKVFKAAGMKVTEQVVHRGMYSNVLKPFPPPENGVLEMAGMSHGALFKMNSTTESWTVIAGPDRTEYNIVFVGGDFQKTKSASYRAFIVMSFDIGLCQIGYDGKIFIKTEAYQNDVDKKTITLINPNDGSREHLERIVKKYPDWTPCLKAKKLLETKPALPSSNWGY